MKTVIGIVLIVGAIGLGYMGAQKWEDGSKSVSIGNLELSANNKSTQEEAYLYLGGAIALLVGGVFVLKKKG
jgi:uncharacterized membrane protein YidH (DUF202 family)